MVDGFRVLDRCCCVLIQRELTNTNTALAVFAMQVLHKLLVRGSLQIVMQETRRACNIFF